MTTEIFVDDIAPLGRKQRRFLARANQRVNLIEGSVRSGKTYIALIRWLLFIAADAPKRGALIMVGKSRDTVFRNIFEPIENDPTLAAFKPFVHYRQGAPTAIIFGRIVHVVGANDAKAELKIRGMTLAGGFVDELTTLPAEFWRQLLARASVIGAMIFATTNPDAPRHWLRTEYLLRLDQLPDWGVWRFTMKDNPSLSLAYITSLMREYTGVWFQRFILGRWVAAEGAIYDMLDKERHVIKHADLPNIERVLCAGVDYGTTHHTRGYLLGIGRTPAGLPALYVLSEFAPGAATVGEHAQMFKAWLAGQSVASWREPDWIAIDPAAAVFRQQVFSDGFSGVLRAHNAVLPGIQVVSSLLAAGRLFISDSCTQLIDALPGYVWDSAAAKRGETKPIKQNDDEADALRYAVFTMRRFWKTLIPIAAANDDSTDESD